MYGIRPAGSLKSHHPADAEQVKSPHSELPVGSASSAKAWKTPAAQPFFAGAFVSRFDSAAYIFSRPPAYGLATEGHRSQARRHCFVNASSCSAIKRSSQ